jgi:hypothetical protein
MRGHLKSDCIITDGEGEEETCPQDPWHFLAIAWFFMIDFMAFITHALHPALGVSPAESRGQEGGGKNQRRTHHEHRFHEGAP